MTWLPNDEKFPTDDVLALCPELRARYREFAGLFWARSLVDPVLLELCRVRVAQLLGCAPMRAVGVGVRLDQKHLDALDAWADSGLFSERQRACLAFADKFVLSPRSITDEDAAAVARHLSPPEMVAFTEALALLDGFTRFYAMIGEDGDP
jgi:alkylhydroperoxidase family enzyme